MGELRTSSRDSGKRRSMIAASNIAEKRGIKAGKEKKKKKQKVNRSAHYSEWAIKEDKGG